MCWAKSWRGKRAWNCGKSSCSRFRRRHEPASHHRRETGGENPVRGTGTRRGVKRIRLCAHRAENAGIAHTVLRKEKGEAPENYGERLLALLRENAIDVVVLAGFLTILPENVIRAYDHRILNIHPSLIPSFCGDGFYGLHVHEAALKRGVKVTGATVHFVNEITDGGDIIAQKAVEVLPGDTPEILQRRVMEQAEWILLPQALEQVAGEIAKKREKKQ